MARTCADKGCTQAVALHERLAPVFPASPGAAAPHERAHLFPAVRGERSEQGVVLPLQDENVTN